MGRCKVRNTLTKPEWVANINTEDKQLMKDFLEYLETTDHSPDTIDIYRQSLETAFCWALNTLEGKSFTKWSKRDIQRYQNYLVTQCKLSSRRVRLLKSALSSLGNYIENVLDDEYPDFRNNMNKIPSPPVTSVYEKTVLSEEEIDNLLTTLLDMKKYEPLICVALAAYSGRRKSELVRFKMTDFDSDRLICEGALYESSHIRTKGKGIQGKLLRCYTLAKNIEPYLEVWRDYRRLAGIDSEWFLPNPLNPALPLQTRTIDSWCDTFSKIVGKRVYMHCFRHNFTTRLLRAGIPELVIKELMGWDSVDMVACYSDLTKEESFNQYFDATGIKETHPRSISAM